MKRAMFMVGMVVALVAGWSARGHQNWLVKSASSIHDWIRGDEGTRAIAQLRSKLEADATDLQQVKAKLAVGIDQVHEEHRKIVHKNQRLEGLARELGKKLRRAQSAKSFPLVFSGRMYTRSQAEAQLKLLQAQCAGYREVADKLEKTQQKAGKEFRNVIVRLSTTETELASLDVTKSIYDSQQLVNDRQALVARVNGVLEKNASLKNRNPVRSLDEILADSQQSKTQPDDVERLLATYGTTAK